MTVSLSPILNGFQSFTSAGLPNAGGFLYTYAAGTSTLQTTYTASNGSTPNANPIVFDSAGRAPQEIWLTDGLAYKLVVADSTTAPIAGCTYDNISNSGGISASSGSSLVGYTQSGTGATSTTVQAKLRESVSVKDFGAVGDRTTNNLTAVNSALQAVASGSLVVPAGDYVTNSAPTNPDGIRYMGDGKILVPETGGFQQINTYADRDLLLGREYLYRAFLRISLGPAGLGTQLKVFCYGDSTVEGYIAPPASITTDFLVQNFLPPLLNNQGIHNVSVTNRGLSGTSWNNLSALGDLSTDTDLLIIKYGINDGVPSGGAVTLQQRIDRLATNMRAKLAEIRGTAFGGIAQCAILLVGPNSTNDTINGRNEEWYEQVRNVYVQAARDYKCTFFDTYAYMRDSRPAATLWMDNPAVHPLAIGVSWIWGKVISECFPKSDVSYWASNNFYSVGSTAGAILSTKLPSAYKFGMTWEYATAANGFPVEGILVTMRNPDTYAVQTLYPLASARRTFMRYAANTTTWDTVWAGQKVALTLANSWVAFGGGWSIPSVCLMPGGLVVVSGLIKSGTITANTVLTTLPVGYRPLEFQYITVPSSTSTPIRLMLNPTGDVSLSTAGDATYNGLSFSFLP